MKFSMVRILQRKYPGEVPIARRPADGRIPPIERPIAFDSYEGKWVAVIGIKVIASASTSRELARKVRLMGPDAQDSVMRYIRPPVSGYVIGVG